MPLKFTPNQRSGGQLTLTVNPVSLMSVITGPIGATGTTLAILSGARIVTSGNVIVLANEGFIILNKAAAAATTIFLPSVAARDPAGLILEIYDWAGNAGDITLTPDGTDTVMGLSSWTIGSGGVAGSGGSLRLLPSTDLNGWLVR